MTATLNAPLPAPADAPSPGLRLVLLPLDLLRESPLNTRKHFDPAKLAELQASIEKSGILTPLLVRPHGRLRQNGASGVSYEVAAGHRRLRAGKLAGVVEAPCIVREMDDATFLEILTIENLQREDVHPLEEAEGYKNLLTLQGYDPKKIAQRVGKSESYVYDRLKLLQLIAPAKKLFLEHRFSLAHAILLARLGKDDQKRCLAIDADDDNEFGGTGGMWQNEGDAHPALGLDDPAGVADEFEGRLKPRSVRELQAWIDNHVRFTAPDEATPHLFADTAAQLEQAKTSQQKVIEISRDHQLKEDAKHPDGKRTYCVMSWARADGQPEEDFRGNPKPSKICDHSVLGVVVAGRGRGESFQVCIDKKRCTTHWGDVIKERNRRERAREKVSAGRSGEKPKGNSESSWQREERLQSERYVRYQARWAKGGDAVLAAIAQKVQKLAMDSTGPAGTWFWDRIQEGLYGLDDHAKLATKLGVRRGTTPADLMRQAIMCHLVEIGEPDQFGTENEQALQEDLDALKLRVNVKQLLDAANPAPPPKANAEPKRRAKR